MDMKKKQICRFCLTTNRPLTNIYKTTNQDVPLSLQIVSCSSIEVFPTDKMPAVICEHCVSLMDFCYRFKQMCKDADAALKLVPVTKVWPQDELPYPVFAPDAPFTLMTKTEDVAEEIVQMFLEEDIIEAPASPLKIEPIQLVAEEPEQVMEIINLPSPEPEPEPIPVPVTIINKAPRITVNKAEKAKPKVLNKMPAKVTKPEEPSFKKSKNGNVEIIMEKKPDVLTTDVFACKSCDRTFPLKQLLEIHERNHTRDKTVPCMDCDKSFYTKYDLNKHMAIHTKERPHVCVVCNKAFSRSTLLYRHQSIHRDLPHLKCAECDRIYFSQEEMDQHMEKHAKSRPYKCPFCPKSFAHKQGMERHEVIHAAAQPFNCTYCDAGFNTNVKLMRHLTMHAGKRPFPCRYCQKSFLLSHHLTRHMRSHTDKTKNVFKCSKCLKSFNVLADLVRHLKEHEVDEGNTCSLCMEKIETVEEFETHLQEHLDHEVHACEFCDLIFIDGESLQRHSERVHVEEERMYQEDIARNMKDVKKVKRKASPCKLEEDLEIDGESEIVHLVAEDVIEEEVDTTTPVVKSKRVIGNEVQVAKEVAKNTIPAKPNVIRVKRFKLGRSGNPESGDKQVAAGVPKTPEKNKPPEKTKLANLEKVKK